MDKIKLIVKENAERLGLLMLEFSIKGGKIEATLVKSGGDTSIVDLESLTRQVSQNLEKLGLGGIYELCFLSAGLDRILKNREEMDIFVGREVKFAYQKDGKVNWETGILRGNSGENVLFETDLCVKEIPFKDINKVSLFVKEFSDRKGGKK